jgi:hypothetical protein
VLARREAVTASVALLAVLVPRPLPQLKLWLPLVPQVYTYAPLLAAVVLWTMLTASKSESTESRVEVVPRNPGAEPRVAVSAA